MKVIRADLLNDMFSPDFLSGTLNQANVVGVGEGAHFVSEFSSIRFNLIKCMVERHDFNAIFLECSASQAERLNEWFLLPDLNADISRYASHLTKALYGTVLARLKLYLKEKNKKVELIGMDVPNTMSPLGECMSLKAGSLVLDPNITPLLDELETLLKGVEGGSAVTSSEKWGKLHEDEQNKAFTIVSRLRLRFKATAPLLEARCDPHVISRFYRSLLTLQYTLEALFGMRALFDGHAIEAETSVRDHFMAQSVENYLDQNPDAKIIVLAHNNHIQKVPVVFSGKTFGVPMGMHLKNYVGYRSIALTHIGDRVPEMNFPELKSPVGFSVTEVDASPIENHSVENLCLDLEKEVGAQDFFLGREFLKNIRSQSSIAELDVEKAFDIIVYSLSAAKDVGVEF